MWGLRIGQWAITSLPALAECEQVPATAVLASLGGLGGGQVAAFGRVTRRDQRQHEGTGEPLVDPHALEARHLLRGLRLEPCGPGEGETRALCNPEDGGQQCAQRE